MTMSKDEKQAVIKKFAVGANDTGSAEVQIALLSKRITELAEHLRLHKKDNHSRRGLLGMVNKRNGLLKYLRRESLERYNTIIAALQLRAKSN